MDLTKMNHLAITISGYTFKVNAPVLNWLLVCSVLAIVFIVVGNKFKKADPTKTPSKSLLVFESIAQLIYNMLESNLGKYTRNYIHVFGTILLVMIPSNLLGLLGLQPPTSNIGVNAVLAIVYFLMIQFNGLKNSGLKGRFKELCEPFAFLLPLNVLGELALPISLSVRLFGNILSGSIIMLMVYTLMDILGVFGYLGLAITPLLHIYFDVFSGFIQGYIFLVLGSFFLGQTFTDK